MTDRISDTKIVNLLALKRHLDDLTDTLARTQRQYAAEKQALTEEERDTLGDILFYQRRPDHQDCDEYRALKERFSL